MIALQAMQSEVSLTQPSQAMFYLCKTHKQASERAAKKIIIVRFISSD